MNSTELDRRGIIDSEHLRLLSIFHFIAAALGFVGTAFAMLYFAMFQAFFANPELWAQAQQGPPPAEFMSFFRWFLLAFGIWFLVAAVGNLLSGFYMLKRRHRALSMVVAVINCLYIPIGSILGVFTLIVLSRESVQASYELSSSRTTPN